MISKFDLVQTIDFPTDRLFAFLRDFSHMPLWNYYVKEVRQITPGDIAKGTVFEQKRPHDVQQYRIVELNPPQLIRVALLPPGPDHVLTFILEPLADKTRVTYSWYVDLGKYKVLAFVPGGIIKRWLLGFADRHIQRTTRPAVEQNFSKLKTLLEHGEVVLQDGRKITWPA